jgi:LmbE family N-acetylglucosaminyl deacetylase
MNVLVIASHPDDEVLGCGGTIARLAAEGHAVDIAILGEGITARYDEREKAETELLRIHRERAQRAGHVLGARAVHLFDLPDNRFDSIPLLDVVKKIEGLLERLRPEVVYTQHGGDLNVDHVITYRATLTATRPMAGGFVKAVYAYEVGSSTEWAFQRFAPVFHPNLFVDVSATLPQKLDAMAVYESEARAFPHPRSREALEAAARRWGSVAGLLAAEAFEIVREIR